MRKISLLAAAATVIPACVAAWLAYATHAYVDAAADARIDPIRIMVEARDLPVEIVVDFSTVH
jgi:hypothetical protein